jgi:hypothetical protein
MTEAERAGGELRIVVAIDAIPQSNLDACARVFARLTVENVLRINGLDIGRTIEDDADNQHKSGPAGAINTDRAKEQVL